ncbi:mycothiol synthase [Actinomadura harenae]|uniref:Mycothiol acetyltransferase n=1 Tax=Actinomadura harenae TaxID=2483351 RepID=A0A3M2LUC7_9ACTN|nr:mycothiol synthase [Actinomadura harenae]RMI38528.1 mycothiol synthase [Actinomadura harenae]
MTESQIVELVEAATKVDGVAPLSEHAMLALKAGRIGVVVRENDTVVGYAHLDPATDDEPASGELVVHPEHRRRGFGRRLVRELKKKADGPLRVWAHGDLAAAARLGESEGMARSRVLFQMRKSADDPMIDVVLPPGVTIRPFQPGRDEEAWLEVNARAFATHPEQGQWTIDDVRAREAEDWFDPEGFFLAERDGRLIGFHWTKTHPDGLGEVYVIGVDPSAQGLGLGRTLTLTGLHHLRDRGVPAILLYVDEDNRSAMHLYDTLGFARYSVDVMYAT